MRLRALLVALALAVPGVAAAQGTEPATDTPQAPRQIEILTEKPSGFWTSNRPAQGGAYKWRLLALGVVLAGVTGFVMLRLIRRANAQRTRQVWPTNRPDANPDDAAR